MKFFDEAETDTSFRLRLCTSRIPPHKKAWLWGKLTGTTFLFTRDLAQVLQKKTCYDTEKLKNTIAFEYTPIGQTIDRIVKQYLAEKNG